MSRTEARLLLAADHVRLEPSPLADAVVLPFAARNVAAATAALDEALQTARQRGSKSVRVELAGIWLRWQSLPWGVTAERLVAGWQALHATQPYRLPGMLARVPAAFLETLTTAAHGLRLTLAAAPEIAVARVLKQAGEGTTVVAVLENDCLTFVRLQGGFLVEVSALPAGPEDNALTGVEAAWHRLALRDAGFAQTTQRFFLDMSGRLPRDATPGSFVRVTSESQKPTVPALLDWPLQTSPWRSWKGAAFAAGLVVCFAAGLQLQAALAERDAVEARRQNALPPMPLSRVSSPVEQKARALAISRVNAAVRQLNAPVETLLRAVRPKAQSGIVLLGVQLRTGGERKITVEGTADTMDAMAAYVKHLSAQPVFTSVWLSRHEGANNAQKTGYQFMVEAGWRE